MFWVRLASGAALVVLSFLFIYLGGPFMAVFVCLLSLEAFFEMGRALKLFEKKQNSLMITGYIGITAYYVFLALAENTTPVLMAGVLTVIAFLAVYVFTFPKYNAENVSGAIYAFVYAPVMLSFMVLTRYLENGVYLVWMIYISAWGADTLAYCVGMLTGKTIGNHKMTPVLSPKKSIEGAVGGVLGAALLSWLYGKFVMTRVVDTANIEWILALIGGVCGFISMIGDLAASAVKRNKDVKDYGHCIPGHGGILDRFDSMIFTAPLTYFLSVLFFAAK